MDDPPSSQLSSTRATLSLPLFLILVPFVFHGDEIRHPPTKKESLTSQMLGGRTTGAVIVFLTASKFFFLVCCLVFLPVPGLTGAAAVLSDVLESCPARVATSSILPDGVVAFSRRFFFLLAKMDFVDLIFFWVPIRL